MTTVQQHLVAKTKESDRTHVIVMTAVVAVISATAALVAGSASSTLLSAPRHEAVTVDARASEAPVMPQSLGYLEFDWSTASRGVPGFAPCRATQPRTSALHREQFKETTMSRAMDLPSHAPEPVYPSAWRRCREALAHVIRIATEEWMVKRTMDALHYLDARTLKDIGITRSEIESSARWRRRILLTIDPVHTELPPGQRMS